MDLDKLFGSKAKVDILKYLLFKRQWLSLRALESDLTWTFPAIKKQVDSLAKAGVLEIDKEKMKWSITIDDSCMKYVKWIFVHSLKSKVEALFTVHEYSISQYYFWKVFGKDLEMDLVIVHNNAEKIILDQIKEEISTLFNWFFIHSLSVTFMSISERQQRNRLADKFVLKILATVQSR